jgi:hypothetical protein
MIYHSDLEILICLSCQAAFPPSNMPGHQQKQHNIVISAADMESILATFAVMMGTNMTLPPEPCAPIDGIKIHSGLHCTECSYACRTEQTFDYHFRHAHHDKLHQPRATRSFKTPVQTIFDSSVHRHYFSIDDTMVTMPEQDPYHKFLAKILPQVSIIPQVVAPTTDRDLPVLVKKAEWHQHLQEYCNDQQARALLLQMSTLPETSVNKIARMDDGIEKTLTKLPLVVEKYMERIRQDAHQANRMTLRNLLQYPA